ncbi:hypothetical protein BDZ97DRAFT_1655459 [Flammula alnicola]|nr:hypothetical protein BDZ97DRAFT_1655459 [Flammula alnicola]
MTWQHVASLSIFSAYFCTIFGLLLLIIYTLSTSKASSNALKSWIFVGLTLGSFAHTWFYMFKYMEWSFSNYERLQNPKSQDLIYRVASWLYDTSLFEEAWALVCFQPMNWWWSEQLCLFTVGAWTVFIAIEGTRHKVKHLWAYMLLGQIVAISVASNLFYLALILSPPPSPKSQSSKPSASPKLWLSVLLSLATVAISPFTSSRTFLPNLLVMHALLFIPLISADATPAPYSISTKALYRVIHIVAAIIHIRTVLNAVGFLNQSSHPAASHVVAAAWSVLHAHPAQSSIGWDVIWTSVSFIVWMLLRPREPSQPSKLLSASYLLLSTPVACIGVTAPYALLPRREPAGPVDVKEE